MSISQKAILIVDDNATLRMTLSLIFREEGYQVRVAADGFSALAEMRQEALDVLLSDLNMPGMSGFELLSVVRRRFPSTRVIAMSGAFSGDEVPQGIAADAFYSKGSGNPASLLQLVHGLMESKRPPLRQSTVPIWISKTPIDLHGNAHVVIACPECLRAFPKVLGDNSFSTHEMHCLHCSSTIRFGFVQPELETDMTGIAVAGDGADCSDHGAMMLADNITEPVAPVEIVPAGNVQAVTPMGRSRPGQPPYCGPRHTGGGYPAGFP
jgi:CheY-like chemotaxis protein